MTSRDNPNTRRTIVVSGATGKQGGAALRHLRQRGFPVRAMTRNPDRPEARGLAGEGAAVVRGDFDDAASLTRALDDAYGVFSVQNSWEAGVEAEVRQGKAIATVAQRVGVSHFVYSSVGGAERRTGVPHFDSKYQVEEHIRGLGMRYSILRPVFFMENWLGMAGMLKSGAITFPLTPDCRLQHIAVNDIGAFVAMAFEHGGKWQGREVELAGDEASMTELAALFGRVLGREVRYVQIPWDEFEGRMGREYASMFRWFQEQGYRADIAALRGEYSGLTTLERWARAQDWERAGAESTARAR